MTARQERRRPLDRNTLSALIIVLVFLYMIRTILLPFVAAGMLAYVCTPLVDGMARRFRLPRIIVVIAVFLVFACAAALLGWAGIPPLVAEARGVIADLPHILETLAKRAIGSGSIKLMGASLNAAQISAAVIQSLKAVSAEGGRLLLLASWSFAGIFGFFLAWVLFFYFLAGAHRIADSLFWLVPPPRRDFAHRTWRRLDPILRRYLVGIAVVVAYACIAAYVGLGLILGLRHAVFLALLTGLLEMVPVAGPGLSAVIGGLVAIAEAKGVGQVVAYILYAIALRLSIDQMLGPVVLGRAARLPPALVIFAFLSGAVLFGIAGVILAVPVCLAIKAVLATLYDGPAAELPA